MKLFRVICMYETIVSLFSPKLLLCVICVTMIKQWSITSSRVGLKYLVVCTTTRVDPSDTRPNTGIQPNSLAKRLILLYTREPRAPPPSRLRPALPTEKIYVWVGREESFWYDSQQGRTERERRVSEGPPSWRLR